MFNNVLQGYSSLMGFTTGMYPGRVTILDAPHEHNTVEIHPVQFFFCCCILYIIFIVIKLKTYKTLKLLNRIF